MCSPHSPLHQHVRTHLYCPAQLPYIATHIATLDEITLQRIPLPYTALHCRKVPSLTLPTLQYIMSYYTTLPHITSYIKTQTIKTLTPQNCQGSQNHYGQN